MIAATTDQGLLLIFFIYGLAFFSMGLAMALEIGRSPALAEARLLRPLAVFGFLHGINEWLEFFVGQAAWAGIGVLQEIGGLRPAILSGSFIALLWYGMLAFRTARQEWRDWARLSFAVLILYTLAIITSTLVTYATRSDIPWIRLLDALVRYLLAVPGAMLAALGLRSQSIQLGGKQRQLAGYLNSAALAFAFYGLTQLFVPSLEMFPANVINTENLLAATGVPHQVIRTVLAVLITFYLIRATQAVEQERQIQALTAQEQLLAAQEARLDALQQQEFLRRELLRHTVRAQEDERGRIARELHDDTAQLLSAFTLELATLRNNVRQKPESKRTLDRLHGLSRQMSQGIYRLVYDLRPAQLDDLGLVPALKSLLERDCCPNGLDVTFEIGNGQRRLDPLIETVLFRVAQESLNNVSRHSGAKQARVRLRYETDQVTLQIMDKGLGFNPAESFHPPRGWGLAGMQERVESVGGELHLTSAPGQGTTVEVIVPLDEATPHR